MSTASRFRQRVLGYFLRGLGWLFGFMSVGAAQALGRGRADDPGMVKIYFFMVFVFGVSSFPIYRLGRRMTSKLAEEMTTNDFRPPILLLRSFKDDDMVVVGQDPLKVNIWPVAGTKLSLEELIVRIFSKSGPVVAIGKPSDRLPLPGAGRFWVDDDHWKQRVEALLAKSQRVIMVLGEPGNNDGLSWEVERLFTATPPEKIVLIVPCIEEEEVWSRWAKYRTISGGRLPNYCGGEIVVRFTPDWRAIVTRAVDQSGFGYGRKYEVYETALHLAFGVMIPTGGGLSLKCLIVEEVDPPSQLHFRPLTGLGPHGGTAEGADVATETTGPSTPRKACCPHCEGDLTYVDQGKCPLCGKHLPRSTLIRLGFH